jgi:hypothetical protein
VFVERVYPPPDYIARKDLIGAYQFCQGQETWEICLLADRHFTIIHRTEKEDSRIEATGNWDLLFGYAISLKFDSPDKKLRKVKYDLCTIADHVALIENPPRVMEGGKRHRRVYSKAPAMVVTEPSATEPRMQL